MYKDVFFVFIFICSFSNLSFAQEVKLHKTKLLLKYHIKNDHISSGFEPFKVGVFKIKAFSVGVGASF
jgi:hypothetical protein